MRRTELALTGVLILALLSACGGGGGGGGTAATATLVPTGTNTAQRTPTATASHAATIPATSTAAASATSTPTQAAQTATTTPSGAASVAGLAVLRQDYQAAAGDALGAPPAAWMDRPGSADFDRGLSFATWRIDGPVQRQGETGSDGSFAITDLPPGEYTLELSKTINGNLLSVSVPFHVGDQGRTDLVVEIAQGAVRSSNAYEEGGAAVRETSSANGGGLVTRDGVITQLSGSGRSYVDMDGDGTFDPTNCTGAPALWKCAADGDCGADRVCACVGSCPDCEDCPATVCAPKGTARLYRCGDQQCADAQDSCVCVSSCAACDDCAASACAPSCAPAQITGITISGPQKLYVGQRGNMTALANLSDGGVVDVTQLVEWTSSDTGVVALDPWGNLEAVAIGSAAITAALGEHHSDTWNLEVAARPPLQHIYLQNLSCNFPYGAPDAGPEAGAPRPLPSGVLLPPDCRQVVRIGGTVQFFALGEFEDGYYEDITSIASWELDPAGIGEVAGGLFTGVSVGTTQLRARLGEVVSDATALKVVDQPTIVALQIYPLASVPRPGPQLPDDGSADAPIPCYDCGYTVTILKGDQLPFQATAAYDTGDWADVTAQVTWSSSDAAAPIDAKGVLSAVASGETVVTASLGDVTSNQVKVRVVESATLLSLSIYQEGLDRVVAKGDQAFFRALGYYDIGLDRDVTGEVTWRSSDETIGGFDGAGTFVGRSAGNVEVWAELGGVESNHIPIEVFQTSSLAYCDENNINRVEWSDAFNRVVLESDCALYSHPGIATLRFTVTERDRPNGVFDPCLDLYVYQGDRVVRTIREEGCGQPFLAPGAPEYDSASVRYQTLAFWDLRDDRGSPVPPGSYTIRGRFYLYYDPVVSLPVVVNAPDGRIPCVDNACGNGCGYVHACGDDGPPDPTCPAVCTKLCECPAGWGITAEGDCEPCAQECCPRGAACLPGTPTCEPPPVCCPAGQSCIPELPPCGPRCCPFGALCGPLALPVCDCCPAGADCAQTDLPPCEPPPPCCPKGALCILPLPTCPEDCCPPGAQCADGLVPCDQLMCCRADGTCIPDQAPCM